MYIKSIYKNINKHRHAHKYTLRSPFAPSASANSHWLLLHVMWLRFVTRAPRSAMMQHLSIANEISILIQSIIKEYVPFCFSKNVAARRSAVAVGPQPTVQDITKGTKAECSTSRTSTSSPAHVGDKLLRGTVVCYGEPEG